MKRFHWLLIGAVLLLSCATTAQRHLTVEAPEHRLSDIFERFDHRVHMPVMDDVGWICLPCHTIGATKTPDVVEGEVRPTFTDPASSVLLPTQRICHTCHEPDNALGAPSPCRTCHETEDLPPPENHAVGWTQDHSRDAVLQPEFCAGCHTGWMCAECHMRRDAAGTEVHTGNWLSVHGMAARTDPVSCEDCHQGDTCQTCHTEPSGRQGW
jgi:hypothetical protein